MARVLVFGTFDLLHPGHIALIKEASLSGDVTISLTTDELCRLYKKKSPHHSYEERCYRLMKLRGVHEIVAADSTPNSYAILSRVRPDIVLLGYDQRGLKPVIEEKARGVGLSVRILVAEPYRRDLYHTSHIAALSIVPDKLAE